MQPTDIKIIPVTGNKKQFLDLLLLADEQESMIDRYLERGEMFALYKDDLKCTCVVTQEGNGVYELKNIAVYPQYQRQGYGKQMIHYLFDYYKGRSKTMLVGTGDSPLTLSFYEDCGFVYSHRIPNFFTDNYDHPMFEAGKQLVDMIYLRKDFSRVIEPAQETDYDELVTLWEASVRSSHHFLTEDDILFYKPLVRNKYFKAVRLYIIRNEQNRIVAFTGLSDDLIEMLFVHPGEQGKRYGKRLIDFALNEKHIRHVDVNEQNEQALRFYLQLGFKITGRDATDPMGKPFPILHMTKET